MSGYASDLAVDEKDIYVSGADDGQACYWRNGQKVILCDRGETSAIDVANENVIVVGDDRSSGSLLNGYWNNGKFETRDQQFQSVVRVKFDGSKGFLLGNQNVSNGKEGKKTGFLEENGQLRLLTAESAGTSTEVKDVIIYKSIPYVLGTVQVANYDISPKLCYWIKDKAHLINASKGMATSIFVY